MPTSVKSPSAPAKTLRAAVIGCGRIGCAFDDEADRGAVSTHAGAYARETHVRLRALCDIDPARLAHYADKFGVASRYTDHRALLAGDRPADELPDIVSICTGVATHAPLAVDCAAAGVRAVFCEKPLADSLPAADRMIAACRDAGTLLFVGHQRRFDATHRAAAAFVRSTAFGPVRQASAYYTAGIANTGTHLIDLVRMFLGEVARVVAWPSGAAAPDPADPNLDAVLHLRSGATVTLQALDVRAYTIFELHLLGAGGRLRIMAHGFEMDYERVVPHPRFAGYHGLQHAAPPFPTQPTREYLRQAVRHIVDCLSHPGTAPWSTGADGRAALEVILALRASAARGGAAVDLPFDTDATLSSR